MMFMFSVGELDGFVKAVGATLGRKRAVPVLDSLLLEVRGDGQVWVAAYDYEFGLEAVLDSSVGVVPDSHCGRLLVHLEDLRSALKAGAARDLIELSPVAGSDSLVSVSVSSGFRAEFGLLDLEDFPVLPQVSEFAASVRVPALAYRQGVATVAEATGTDDTLPMLMGNQLWARDGKVKLRATDRFRAHDVVLDERISGDLDGDWLVPGRALSKSARWLVGGTPSKPQAETVRVGTLARDGQVWGVGVRAGNRIVHARLIDASFPKVDQLMPSEFAVEFTVDPQELLAALKPHMSLRNVRLDVGEADLIVASEGGSQAVGIGEFTSADGLGMVIAFNPGYLAGAIKHVPRGVKVRVGLVSPSRPAVFSVERDRNLLMPVRLPEGAVSVRSAA